MSKELEKIDVRIIPQYYTQPSGVEHKQLEVHVLYKNKSYRAIEPMWNTDAVSVIDYCFDICKRHIKEMIEQSNTPNVPLTKEGDSK